MSQSSNSSVAAVATNALLVRDVDGHYRAASNHEVLQQARRLLAQRVRRGPKLLSPQAVKDYLCKGSHVNLVGHLRNNNYPAADGGTVYALAFTVDEIDYLDSRAEGDARRERHAFVDEIEAHEAGQASAGTARRPARKAAARKPAAKKKVSKR